MMPHPVVRLLVWGLLAVSAQFAAGLVLIVLWALALLGAAWIAPLRLVRLLRRTRWLMLAIAILFAWGTPGVLLLPSAASLSPTVDGVALGATHLARLMVLLASLALLLEVTPSADLVGALFSLMAPLRRLGLDRARIAVRLLLVIEYVESAESRTWRDWLEPSVSASGHNVITLRRMPFRLRDGVALGVAVVVGGLLAWAA